MNEPPLKPQQNLEETLRRVFEALARRDATELARHCGGRALGGAVEIDCLGRTLAVDVKAREVRASDGSPPIGDLLAAVSARYVMLSRRLAPEPGPEIGFADWPDARNYAGPFRGRALGALIGRYGREPEAFARASEALGGERVDVEASGAVAYRLRVFPRASVTVVLHPGDDELSADGQMLFARSLFEAFAPDDMVALGEIAGRALRGRL